MDLKTIEELKEMAKNKDETLLMYHIDGGNDNFETTAKLALEDLEKILKDKKQGFSSLEKILKKSVSICTLKDFEKEQEELEKELG